MRCVDTEGSHLLFSILTELFLLLLIHVTQFLDALY